ncbi:TonB-dependent receptor [Bacteroides sp. UBA939]|uniref:TonB-dependent receptor n=1 Tax=Bacteroides sp. UBA939 TaxID=1946092 RepID=UPI0025B82D7A|nr:TonB-dependent receptor [Bacteroides sp. UBA939]
MRKLILSVIMIIGLFTEVAAQSCGTIRGVVVDAASGQTLPYVNVVVLNSNPFVGVTTGEQGTFNLPSLPIGRYNIQASFVGYEPATIREVMVSSAKEVILEISMKESLTELKEVVVRPKTNKEAPLNPMALAGARMLSVEEASRYAGGLDDPARLVASFAGAAGDVTSNSIAIRGNSPQSLQWRLEGVEIPNPSHYPEIGGVGGGILTAFSSQVLGNSDFFAGAFPAEYGNALSGVFDMMLRNGNNQQYEHTAQLGTLGVEFASEGPFKKGGRASYLFNYRYSTMALAGDIVGGSLKEVSGMRYQDLSFKINIPTKKAGTFSLWGIGTNDRYLEPLPDNTADHEYLLEESRTRQYMGVAGLGHKIFLDGNTYLKSTLAATYSENHAMLDRFDRDGKNPKRTLDMLDKNTNLVLHSYLNKKFNARHTNRTGITLTGLLYDDNYNMVEDFPYGNIPMMNFANSNGSSMLISAFSQSSYQFSDRFLAELGVNAQYFALNKEWTVEPRASIRWQAAPRHALALAVGAHSRHERLDYYFVTTPETGDRPVNKDLDLAKAYHAVLSYDWKVSDNIHFKVEPYFQYLYDVPVIPGTGISIINQTDFYMNKQLINNGKGRNFGVDFTLERYLKDGYYYMLTASVFDSKYRGDDGIWRNTRYNRRFLVNALGGKEWMMGKNKQNVLGVNLRVNLMGGTYYTPIDEAASLAEQRPIEDENRMMGSRNPASVVVHATVNYKINKPGLTHEFGAKMINVTGSKEYFGFDYNYQTNEMDRTTASVGIPNIYYKISF